MEFATQVTAKQLDFIDDVDLRFALDQRLNELDRVFLVNAHYSTVFVAIGTLEGIFKHIAARFKPKIMASASYPKDSKGRRRKFEDLAIDELYVQLRDLDIMPVMDEYPALFKLFRGYRNCMHPQAQVRKGWEINIGQAQMALGLLNATVRNLDRNVFVGKHVFEKIAGSPYYDSKSVLPSGLASLGTTRSSCSRSRSPAPSPRRSISIYRRSHCSTSSSITQTMETSGCCDWTVDQTRAVRTEF